MSVATWTTYSAPTTAISFGALATGSWATSGTTLLDNSTALRLYADLEVVLGSATTAGADAPRFDLYLVPVPNGTNAPTPPGTGTITATNAPPASYFVGSVQALPGQSFTRGVLRGVVLPPGKYLLAVQSNLGVTLPAGNVLNFYSYGEQAI